MQHPVGYKVSGGKAELTSVWSLLSSTFAVWAGRSATQSSRA
jgi:hypothetical protein